MPLTIKQIWFSFLFLLSWLVLLLLGESYLGYVILGGVSVFLLLFSRELEWQRVRQYGWLSCLWLIAMLAMGVSAFFSINYPLSLYVVTRFSFIFLVFWFFLLLKKSFIFSQFLIKLLLLLSVVVLTISTSFQFFPNLAHLLPGMNLLHATYGHNHLAALLLLVIPLSWWLASEYAKKGQSHGWWLLPLSFSLSLLFSFGRVAVVIGLIQFLFVYRQLKKNNFLQQKYFNLILKTLLVLFLLVLASNTFFSVVTVIKPDFVCPVPSLKRQLCKSISTESRPEYWQWAVKILQANLVWGSGPGTFSLAAQKYHFSSFGGAAHAHNVFLEYLADMGVVGGGLSIILIVSLLFEAAKTWRQQSNWSWSQAAFLSVMAIYVDVLFDFDWDFIGIYSITLVLLALLIKETKPKLIKNNFQRVVKASYYVVTFILILMAGLYLKTDNLIKADQIQSAFHLFPYFHWHYKIYESSSNLSEKNKQKFYQIYHAQPAIYLTWIETVADDATRQHLKERWFELSPWNAVKQNLISYYLERNDLISAQKWFDQQQALYQQSILSNHEIDSKLKENNGSQALSLAQSYVSQNDYQSALKVLTELLNHRSRFELIWVEQESASKLLVEIGNELAAVDIEQTVQAYQLAKKDLPWILSAPSQLWFEKYPQLELSQADLIQYLVLTADWEGEAIGWKDQAQYQLAHHAVETALTASAWQDLAKLAAAFCWDNYDYQPRLDLVKKLVVITDALVKQQKHQLAAQLIESMNLILPGDYWLMSQPGTLAVMASNFDQARKQYQACSHDWLALNEDDEHHWECQSDLEQLNQATTSADQDQLKAQFSERYFQVSQIIRGEATWQDFE